MSSQKSAHDQNKSANASHCPQVVHQDHHEPHSRSVVGKSRTLSVVDPTHRTNVGNHFSSKDRRLSHDNFSSGNVPEEYDIHVEETIAVLLQNENTDNNHQITVEDSGPQVFGLGTVASGGHRKVEVGGQYPLSNLLQELTLAQDAGKTRIHLRKDLIFENPVNRLSRVIRDVFWPGLTRRIDGSNIARVGRDPKDWTADPRPRIYIPHGAPEQHQYYTRIAKEHPEMRLDVRWLSTDPGNEEYVRDLNEAPGLLALEMERIKDTPKGEPDYRGLPFVVPGGRFNELYGWDSYMETLGLLVNDRVDLAKSMVRHFCFCIKHYGKILNANRTYYLCRTQPPFLTDMALQVYRRISTDPDAREFLRQAILAAIKEYYSVWMTTPRYDPESGLSRYRAQGIGVPPETEATHFVHILTPYAEKHEMTFQEFVKAYNYGKVHEPELDEYFLHDRAVRESGHDTSYRLEKVAADLAVVDLNSCLYKYETDIARTIKEHFNDSLVVPAEFCTKGKTPGYIETSAVWEQRAKNRKHTMDKLMWDEEKGMYFDYHCKLKKQTGYESATTFWAMWAGVCSTEQAAAMVHKALPRLEEAGGLVSGTEASRGPVGLSRPNRQWDYPFGWAPQQILAWTGLAEYQFHDVAARLAYRWLFMVTSAFYRYNGVVVEKYNLTDVRAPHKVLAEYGNQGSDFRGVAKEGFGWVNASYVYGLHFLDAGQRRALGAMATWDVYLKAVGKAKGETAAVQKDLPPHGVLPSHPKDQPSHGDLTSHSKAQPSHGDLASHL